MHSPNASSTFDDDGHSRSRASHTVVQLKTQMMMFLFLLVFMLLLISGGDVLSLLLLKTISSSSSSSSSSSVEGFTTTAQQQQQQRSQQQHSLSVIGTRAPRWIVQQQQYDLQSSSSNYYYNSNHYKTTPSSSFAAAPAGFVRLFSSSSSYHHDSSSSSRAVTTTTTTTTTTAIDDKDEERLEDDDKEKNTSQSDAPDAPTTGTNNRGQQRGKDNNNNNNKNVFFAVRASELEKDLIGGDDTEEKIRISVARDCGPSVAFVTSIWPLPETRSQQQRQRRRRRRRGSGSGSNNDDNDKKKKSQQQQQLPSGPSLGSGSAFVIDERGYLVTNYHVIETAYEIQDMTKSLTTMMNRIASNITASLPSFIPSNLVRGLINATIFQQGVQQIQQQQNQQQRPLPQIYVRINSSTRYQQCRVVGVKPELDVAVLKIISNNNNNNNNNNKDTMTDSSSVDNAVDDDDNDGPLQILRALSFGSSSRLLVGQSLMTIGNPFGLDNSVTRGIVSALNREIRTSETNPGRPLFMRPPSTESTVIRNCIQTDAAINPGNSGGPMLNMKGEVVGINTAIVSTSGSNAGIGFAVPADDIQPIVHNMIRRDVMLYGTATNIKSKPGWMGIAVVDCQQKGGGGGGDSSAEQQPSSSSSSSSSSVVVTKNPLCEQGNWISNVVKDSPADIAGIRPLTFDNETGTILVGGDSIEAINGQDVSTSYNELRDYMEKRCKMNEQIVVTVQDIITGSRRVVYITLQQRPSSQ